MLLWFEWPPSLPYYLPVTQSRQIGLRIRSIHPEYLRRAHLGICVFSGQKQNYLSNWKHSVLKKLTTFYSQLYTTH